MSDTLCADKACELHIYPHVVGSRCSSSQGDRLTPEERGWIEAATGLKNRITADSHMMHAAYIAQLLRIIHRLAPRPGGSEG